MALKKVFASVARPENYPESPGRHFLERNILVEFFNLTFLALCAPQAGGTTDI